MPEDVRGSGIRRLIAKLRRISRGVVNQDVLDEIGTYLSGSIKVRTLAGIDVKERPFKPYSPQYAFFRRKKGLQVDHVDLFFTGSMLNALTYESDVGDKSVKVFFMPGRDKSGMQNAAKAFYLQQTRQFFGATKDDIAAMTKIYRDHIADQIRRRVPGAR